MRGGALTDEKCTHALFARADTPPFHPFPRCTGAENDREKGNAGHGGAERTNGAGGRGDRGRTAGEETGIGRLQWRRGAGR